MAVNCLIVNSFQILMGVTTREVPEKYPAEYLELTLRNGNVLEICV